MDYIEYLKKNKENPFWKNVLDTRFTDLNLI